jgi:Holliday junction DNA helicase RuvA
MIAFIRGTVEAYGTDWVILDNQGMGWQISYPHTDRLHLHEEVCIHTYMHITEQDVSLFGFETREEKDLFLRLISVQGIGPRTVMNMLAKAGYDVIVTSIEAGDVAALKKLPGIGAKSASQIVLDLKGKLVPAETAPAKAPVPKYPQEIEDALEGLKGLGYKPAELNGCAAMMSGKPGLTTKEYLQMGLRYMAKQKIGG